MFDRKIPQHKNVVQIIGVGLDPLSIVVKLYKNGSLHSYLQKSGLGKNVKKNVDLTSASKRKPSQQGNNSKAFDRDCRGNGTPSSAQHHTQRSCIQKHLGTFPNQLKMSKFELLPFFFQLDSDMNPVVSDFGLSKVLEPTRETGRTTGETGPIR